MSQNQLVDITNAVEQECPVGKYFGVSGCGEGVVWTCHDNGKNYRFKVKGEKHSVSKVTKLAEVDAETIESINKFLDYAVTDNRMEQGIKEVNATLDMRKTPDVIKWVITDVIKEESDVIAKSGLDTKELNKRMASRIREIFLLKCKKVN